MKRKYLFIHCSGSLTSNVPFVTVWIGESRRDQRVLRFFNSLRSHSAFFFEKWSKSVDDFRTRCVNSFFPGQTDVRFLRNLVTDGRKLMAIILEGVPRPGRATIPAREIADHLSRRTQQVSTLLCRHDENLRFQQAKAAAGSEAPEDLWRAIVGFCLIGIVVLADFLLSFFMV